MQKATEKQHYAKPIARFLNVWDIVVLLPIFALLVLLAKAGSGMVSPYQTGDALAIQLDPNALPGYALRTVIRMFVALFFSVVFSFAFAYWAAHSKRAESIIIPTVDILQSVPILGFLSVTVVIFIRLFPGSLLGPECAAIFAIFTSQAWNMLLSAYNAFKTIPSDLREATALFRLSAWQRFWCLEAPFAMPSFLWNMMISLSGSWFFLVASEAISVSKQQILLPGIGSYIAVAINQANIQAVGYAIACMLVVILLYDQLLFRPLLAWSQKFTPGFSQDNASTSWVLSLLQRTRFLLKVRYRLGQIAELFINHRLFRVRINQHTAKPVSRGVRRPAWLFGATLLTLLLLSTITCLNFVLKHISPAEIYHVIFLGGVTALRIFVLLILVSCIWVPVGVWIGMHPKATRIAQPVAQFMAAFPANVLFPAVVLIIVRFHLNADIWTSPLMILGTQWFILFNVIAATAMLPKDLYQTAQNLGLKGWLWWRKLALPAILPYYITGALAAAGGAWNASIVAEWVSWGDTHLQATGLGAYIAQYTQQGDFPRIVLGIAVMCLYVLTLNRLCWQPLYINAQKRNGGQ